MTDPEALSTRVGVRTESIADERIQFLKQIGVEDVFVDHTGVNDDPTTISLETGYAPSVTNLVEARRRVEDLGVRFAGVHTIGQRVYEDIMFDREDADEQLETIKTLIKNMGQAGIPVLGYQWNPTNVPARTSRTARVRGGAKAEAYDASNLRDPHEPIDELDREYTEEEFWDNYERFLEEILPVAEEAGVQMAVHPADPPTAEQLGGIPRLLRNFENFKRAMDLVESDNHGLKLCLGCFSEMTEADVHEVIRYFGERDKIFFVHFRDVMGTWPAFTESFIDDDATNFDELEAMRTLREVGFNGVTIPDHVPAVEGDTEWGHRARAHATAYLKGLIKCVHTEC
nr:mannonate dehydratase [Halomicroarcula amylolytica]